MHFIRQEITKLYLPNTRFRAFNPAQSYIPNVLKQFCDFFLVSADLLLTATSFHQESNMANAKQSTTKRLKMAERAQQQMALQFPGIPEPWIWHRKTNDGYTTVPRTMPIAMQAIDMQSKGQPAGHTLFGLWARSPDHPLIVIENPSTFAAEAGFLGERAVDTWRRRMKKLRDLYFIQAKPGPSGEFHYVLLLNPNAALEGMWTSGQMQHGLYSRFIDRLAEVGGFRDVEAVREYWVAYAAAEEERKTTAAAAVMQPETEKIPDVEPKVDARKPIRRTRKPAAKTKT